MHFWRPDQTENPYLGYLAGADVLVVTGESESMLAEAAAAAKPLYIYAVPARPVSWRSKVAATVLASALGGPGYLARLCRGFIESGWVVPPRDLEIMYRGMIEAGVAARFGVDASPQPPRPQPDQAELTARVHQLLDRS